MWASGLAEDHRPTCPSRSRGGCAPRRPVATSSRPCAVEGEGPDVLVARDRRRSRPCPRGRRRRPCRRARCPRRRGRPLPTARAWTSSSAASKSSDGPCRSSMRKTLPVVAGARRRAGPSPSRASDHTYGASGSWQRARGGGQAHAALGVHGEPLGLAVEEVARAFELPELRLGRRDGPGSGQAEPRPAAQRPEAHRTSQWDHGARDDQRSTVRVRSREPVTA